MIVKCQQCDATITVPDAPRAPRYTCKAHAPETVQTVFLQAEQFAYELRPRYYKEPYGSQVYKPRKATDTVPEWTKTDQGIRQYLLELYPNMDTDPRHEFLAERNAAIIYLYFRCRFIKADIARITGIPLNTIRSVVKCIKRRSEGFRANGTGKLTHTPRGRPKNRCPGPNPFIED